jgi:hypothetical protein
MQRMMTIKIVKAVLVLTCLGLLGTSTAMAQEKIKKFYIQAQAMGQAQQLGRSYSVTLIIEELSTAEDQKALFEAFQQKGNEGVVNALSKMHSKGRLSITGTLGYDVNYIRKFSMPDGSTKYRVVTDRPLRFGEVWADTRSSDYNLSGMEVILSSQKGKNSGTLFPALQFSVDKENHIQLEIFQNPWKLVNIMKR